MLCSWMWCDGPMFANSFIILAYAFRFPSLSWSRPQDVQFAAMLERISRNARLVFGEIHFLDLKSFPILNNKKTLITFIATLIICYHSNYAPCCRQIALE